MESAGAAGFRVGAGETEHREPAATGDGAWARV